MVKVRAATDVAYELATSLAPLPNAENTKAMVVIARIQSYLAVTAGTARAMSCNAGMLLYDDDVVVVVICECCTGKTHLQREIELMIYSITSIQWVSKLLADKGSLYLQQTLPAEFSHQEVDADFRK